jgi:hypothetical protein
MGYKPDELNLSRRMNSFIDYTNEDTEFNLEDSILNRSIEIRKALDDKIPRAIMIILDKQIYLDNNRNNNANIQIYRLPIGTNNECSRGT